MLLNIGSFILIILTTGYHVYNAFHRKAMLTRAAGMAAASAFAGVSSFAFGAVLAQSFDFDLSISVAFAILFAIVTGLAGGFPFGRKSAIHAALSGSLGAMLGTVLSSLFFKSNIVVMAAAIVFILGSFLVQKIGEKHLNANNPNHKPAKPPLKKPAYASTVILAVGVAVCAGYILLEKNQIHIGSIGQPQSQIATIDEENDLQVAMIEVSASGITPGITEFKAAAMIKAIINVKANAGNDLKIVSSDLNFSADLKPGENIFLLNNPQPGTYVIEVPSKAYKGSFIVKEQN
ncbi:hypothetical protein FHS15_003408 [Paenibacillus castaneae]|uniref:hypothetical protein n=1 Tax=Paenibacillus castaneae TaxID=474957 RepID=UPI000C99DCCC|nr:hypothetical protein [Paenibacillus castaneae]NIK78270.1 hypothetical protein [Paenibacillus castaneae]